MIFSNILILTGDRVSNDRQSLTLASSLTKKKEILKINFKRYFNIWRFLGSSLLKYGIGNYNSLSDKLKDSLDYEAIICCGSRMAKIALLIKSKFIPEIKIIQILNPEKSFKKFDVVLLPNHDIKKYHSLYDNIVFYSGSLGEISKSLALKKQYYPSNLINEETKDMKSIGVFIGGSSKHYNFHVSTAKMFASAIAKIANRMNASLLVSTSRRTDKQTTAAIKEILLSDNLSNTFSCHFYNANESSGQPNPYHDFIANADYLIVTGDSISMITEMMSTGKPLYVFQGKSLSRKYKLFHQEIALNCGVRFLEESLQQLDSYKYRKLNDFTRIEKAIEMILANKKYN